MVLMLMLVLLHQQKPRTTKGDPTMKKLLVLAPLLLLAACGSSEPDEYGAQAMCESRVEGMLKSPASADFNIDSRTASGNDTWRITGSVDAENSFGANMRTNFVCVAAYVGDDEWITTVPSIG